MTMRLDAAGVRGSKGSVYDGVIPGPLLLYDTCAFEREDRMVAGPGNERRDGRGRCKTANIRHLSLRTHAWRILSVDPLVPPLIVILFWYVRVIWLVVS